MYERFLTFFPLFLFFILLQISFVILFMKLKLDPSMTITNAELVIVSLAIPFSIAWDMFGYVMVRLYLFKLSLMQYVSIRKC